jgi:hypothetical protein
MKYLLAVLLTILLSVQPAHAGIRHRLVKIVTAPIVVPYIVTMCIAESESDLEFDLGLWWYDGPDNW